MAKDFEQVFDFIDVLDFGVDDDADGIIQLVLGTVPAGVSWLIHRCTFKTSDAPSPINGPPPATFELFSEAPPPIGGAAPSGTSLRSYSQAYTEAEADYSSVIRCKAGETLIARWAGFTASFDAAVYLQIEVVESEKIPVTSEEAGAAGEHAVLEGDTPAQVGWN